MSYNTWHPDHIYLCDVCCCQYTDPPPLPIQKRRCCACVATCGKHTVIFTGLKTIWRSYDIISVMHRLGLNSCLRAARNCVNDRRKNLRRGGGGGDGGGGELKPTDDTTLLLVNLTLIKSKLSKRNWWGRGLWGRGGGWGKRSRERVGRTMPRLCVFNVKEPCIGVIRHTFRYVPDLDLFG